MPEDAAPLTEDTPTPDSDPTEGGAPATESTDSSAPVVDWAERYANLQPEYTRATQEAAQYRQIIELARNGDPEALDLLGLEIEGDDDTDDDEPDYRDPRVDQLLAERQAEVAQRQQEAELDQLETHVDGQIEHLAKSAGLDLSSDEIDLVYGALTPGADGQPDVEKAFKKVTGLRDAYVESYRKSKKAPKVELGAAGSDNVNLDTPEARAKALAQMIEAEEQP